MKNDDSEALAAVRHNVGLFKRGEPTTLQDRPDPTLTGWKENHLIGWTLFFLGSFSVEYVSFYTVLGRDWLPEFGEMSRWNGGMVECDVVGEERNLVSLQHGMAFYTCSPWLLEAVEKRGRTNDLRI